MAKIQLNGKKVTIKQTMSIFHLLKRYKLDKTKIALELNGIIIPSNSYKKKKLKDKDKIEVVHFIGGG